MAATLIDCADTLLASEGEPLVDGIRTVLPHIRAHREGGDIVNAAMQHTAPIAAISSVSIVEPGMIFAQRPHKGL